MKEYKIIATSARDDFTAHANVGSQLIFVEKGEPLSQKPLGVLHGGLEVRVLTLSSTDKDPLFAKFANECFLGLGGGYFQDIVGEGRDVPLAD